MFIFRHLLEIYHQVTPDAVGNGEGGKFTRRLVTGYFCRAALHAICHVRVTVFTQFWLPITSGYQLAGFAFTGVCGGHAIVDFLY